MKIVIILNGELTEAEKKTLNFCAICSAGFFCNGHIALLFMEDGGATEDEGYICLNCYHSTPEQIRQMYMRQAEECESKAKAIEYKRELFHWAVSSGEEIPQGFAD